MNRPMLFENILGLRIQREKVGSFQPPLVDHEVNRIVVPLVVWYLLAHIHLGIFPFGKRHIGVHVLHEGLHFPPFHAVHDNHFVHLLLLRIRVIEETGVRHGFNFVFLPKFRLRNL
jgi:hypothetical protein